MSQLVSLSLHISSHNESQTSKTCTSIICAERSCIKSHYYRKAHPDNADLTMQHVAICTQREAIKHRTWLYDCECHSAWLKLETMRHTAFVWLLRMQYYRYGVMDCHVRNVQNFSLPLSKSSYRPVHMTRSAHRGLSAFSTSSSEQCRQGILPLLLRTMLPRLRQQPIAKMDEIRP